MVQYWLSAAGQSLSIEQQDRLLKNLCVGDVGYRQQDTGNAVAYQWVHGMISVLHPATATMKRKACIVPGVATKAAKDSTNRVHARDGTSSYTLVPFGIKSYGCLGSQALAVFND
jgi:hypothetical protein